MIRNPINAIDAYKYDHRRQYPVGTEFVYSNLTPRSTKLAPKADGVDDKVVFFGLQYFIQEFLDGALRQRFFKRNRDIIGNDYSWRASDILGSLSFPTEHISELWNLGYLPITIRALPEGAAVNAGVPMLTIENTLPEFFWLTNYLETVLSCYLWKPCTSATTARKYRQLLERFAVETGGDLSFVPFQCHDFSMRGTSGLEDAMMSGAGHLTSFVGTDSIPAVDMVDEHYQGHKCALIGSSVPATEHSVMCMDASDGEFETFKRLITETYPSGIVSIVSDTWDFWRVITEYLPRLKNEIMARDGKVVIRPDSGDPADIICGMRAAHHHPKAFPYGSPQWKGAIECLWDTFGGTVNDKGYQQLDPHIGLIYGDSITLPRCENILQRLKANGFASTNVVLGIGSYTYEYVTRDTYGFAVKATAGIVNGEVREIFKEPKTDEGKLKKSARGFLRVDLDENGEYVLRDRVSREEAAGGELREVYRDGVLLIREDFQAVRDRITEGLPCAQPAEVS